MDLSLLVLIVSLFYMGAGVFIDLKDKRFPNYIFLSIMMLGLGYYTITYGFDEIYKPLGLFVLFNICGIYFHKIRLVAPGDMKFFSLTAFYLSWTVEESLLFVLFLVFFGVLILALHIYKKEHSIKAIFTSLKSQLIELKIFSLSHIRISKDYTQINKNDGLAFTLPIFLSFLSVLLISNL